MESKEMHTKILEKMGIFLGFENVIWGDFGNKCGFMGAKTHWRHCGAIEKRVKSMFDKKKYCNEPIYRLLSFSIFLFPDWIIYL